MSRFWLVLGFVLLMCASPALAKPVFLAPVDIDPSLLLSPPPADGSPQQVEELAQLKHIEATRTAVELAHARSDAETQNGTIFRDAVGPSFDLSALPKTAKLLDDVQSDEKSAAGTAKNFFLRTRPFVTDPSLKSCSRDEPPQSSYPSGHSTMGYSMGVVLASLIPDKAQDILKRAADYARSRLVCGMHYRSDIEAGEVLGTAVAVELLHNPAFKPEYDAAEAELKAAHLAR